MIKVCAGSYPSCESEEIYFAETISPLLGLGCGSGGIRFSPESRAHRRGITG
jgi:hypothetical protein